MTMKMPFRIFFVPFSLLQYSEHVLAAGRGSSCSDVICVFTGTVVGLVILGIFFVSIAANIAEKGFVRGLVEHKGFQSLFFYLSVIGCFTWVFAMLYEIDKTLAIVFCLTAVVIIHKLYLKP